MKKTIATIVTENSELLKGLVTHTELRNWAVNNGMDNRSAFSRFKDALLTIGIDYDQIKTGISIQEKDTLLKSISHEVTLYTDAKSSNNMYGICAIDGNVLWYGRFFDTDNVGEQSKAELCAASKAVWLALKIKESAGLQAIKLNLLTDAQWLTYQDHSKQKGYKLTQMAKRYNIDLNVKWIPGKDNPADKWTIADGFKKWNDNDLKLLVTPI